jgi:hypothetical protein
MIINNTGFSSVKIFCESKDANVSIHNARKIWSLNTPIVIQNEQDVKMSCSVESCSIPLSYYTINATNNVISINNVVKTVPVGNYSANSIIDELHLLYPAVQFTFNRAKSLFSLFVGDLVDCSIETCENNIYSLMGIEPTTFTGSLIAPQVCNLIYTTGIYVSLNNASNQNIDTATTHQSSNCLLRLPVNQPSNTYLQFFNNIGFKNMLSTSVLNQIDISLLDDRRQYLELTSNVPWVVVLRIDFEKTIKETVVDTKIKQLRSL